MNQNAKRLILIGPILLSLGSLLTESLAMRATKSQTPSSKKSRSMQKASGLFLENCARCHGGDGRGDTPLGHLHKAPDFTDPEWWRTNSKITSTSSLVSIVSRGKGEMPAFGKKLSRGDISLLINYIRRFRNQPNLTDSK